MGDGIYPVIAEFDENGRVARLTVEFIDIEGNPVCG